ncbi:MAG TPA: glutathione S-transferase family protein [Rhodospirillaceae bacterium]|nr:glutathione S-transferase [Rhodospirillaceae bacterium]HAA91400.1 glutathione S-transferase family protein [Rhodospirillaceae bacterium]HAT35582.1 glutathione S-transferase family protein [Rhodospirillaceae bacterium]
MKIFGDKISGNCLKVKYTADITGVVYDWIDIDILKGQTQTEAFLALNPHGQVPVVQFDDGRVLAQSNAIIRYLAHGSTLLPEDPFAQAEIDRWLFWEQYSHEPYIAVCRFQMLYLNKSSEERESWRVERGEAALEQMENHLIDRDWFVGNAFSLADIALLAYTQFAHEGGFDLSSRPALTRWLKACRQNLALKN